MNPDKKKFKKKKTMYIYASGSTKFKVHIIVFFCSFFPPHMPETRGNQKTYLNLNGNGNGDDDDDDDG